MYSRRSSDILKQCVLMKAIIFGKELCWSWRLLVVDPVTFHRWFRVPRPLEVLKPTRRPVVSLLMLMLMMYWCWICWCLKEFIRAQSLGYLSPCQSHYVSNCIDMCVLLQYDIVSICHFGSVLVRSHPGPRTVEWKILPVSCPIYHCNKICMFIQWYRFLQVHIHR